MLQFITNTVLASLLSLLTILCCRVYLPYLRYPILSSPIPPLSAADRLSSLLSDSALRSTIASRLGCFVSRVTARSTVTSAVHSDGSGSSVSPIRDLNTTNTSSRSPFLPTTATITARTVSQVRSATFTRSSLVPPSVPVPPPPATNVGAFNSTAALVSPLSSFSSLSSPPLFHSAPSSIMFASSSSSSSTSSWASRDTQQYLDHYPDQRDNPTLNDNLHFYTNQLPSRPDCALIEHILTDWRGQYSKLERHHGYIQWLFPLREEGMNSLIHPLQPHELAVIRRSQECRQRFLRSYELMLDFYGFTPSQSFGSTGAIQLESVARLRNLISSTHNYLRVTRILKSMGEFGYEHLKLGLVLALWRESRGERGTQYMRKSCDDYWTAVLREERDRQVVAQVKQGTVSVRQQHEYEEVLTRRAEERQRKSKADGEQKGQAEQPSATITLTARKADARSRMQADGRAEKAEQLVDKEEEEVQSTSDERDRDKRAISNKIEKENKEQKDTGEQPANKKTQSTVPMSQEL